MPRNMSFAHTTQQMRDKTKTVTRRRPETWKYLQPGDIFYAVEKACGLKKGEKIARLGKLRCVSNAISPLREITREDVRREGYPGLPAIWFVTMFCQKFGGEPDQKVRRIEFEHLP